MAEPKYSTSFTSVGLALARRITPLTSSSSRPCIDVELIADKEAESPTFRKMFPRLCDTFGAHFAVVTGDAGLTARENATLVRSKGKHFLFWLKDNQPKLNAIADSARCGKVRLRTEDRKQAEARLDEMCRRLLANTTIEEFRFEIVEEKP